jgi:hypothetical protein
MQDMIEPLFEASTQPIEMFTFLFGETLVISIEGLLCVIGIEFVLDLPSRFPDDFPEFRILIGDDRLHCFIVFPSTDHSSHRFHLHPVAASSVVSLSSMARSLNNFEIDDASGIHIDHIDNMGGTIATMIPAPIDSNHCIRPHRSAIPCTNFFRERNDPGNHKYLGSVNRGRRERNDADA